MSDVFKLQYNNMTIAYPGWDGYVAFEDDAKVYTLTINQQTGGTVTADKLSGIAGETVTLSNTRDLGYTFNNYGITGATLTGNQFTFGDSDVTVQPSWTHNVYSVTISQKTGGTVAASPTTGYYGTQVTLSNTPSAEYNFGSYSITGATLTSNKFNFVESNVTAAGSFTQKTYSLTLQTDGHGKLVAGKTTGHKGDTTTLTPSYSAYYRFNNYSVTGGTISNNTFTFGSQNATAKANFKTNAFTASGDWEKGSNVTAYGNNTDAENVGTKYAIKKYATSNTPTAWYATSNRWKVTSTVSAYKITLNPKMTFSGKCQRNSNSLVAAATGLSLIGSTTTQSQSWSTHSATAQTWNYNKSFTANTTGVNYGISGKVATTGAAGQYGATATYIAANTTGTWTATGYIP